MKHYQMYIDGEWCDAADGARLDSINPATVKVWATVAVAGEVEVNRAVAAADRAPNEGPWAQMNATQRAKAVSKRLTTTRAPGLSGSIHRRNRWRIRL